VLLVVAVFQVVLVGWRPAVVVVGGLLLSVALAALVTLTTRVTAMLDAFVRVLAPLRHVGVDPDRVALVLALTVRCIPLLAGIVHDVADARRARGLGWSVRALVTPAVIRALRSADALGEALIARGVDD
jgi:biotin transport system permease protein